MKHALLAAGVALALVTAATAGASGETVQATMSGKCLEVDKLDTNGALASALITCTASGACKCAGGTKLGYSTQTTSPGNGDPSHESGSFVATGPEGTVTLLFKGSRTALGTGKGTWTLGKVKGYTGTHFVRHGTYLVTTKTVSSIVGTRNTIVKVTATLSPWLAGPSS